MEYLFVVLLAIAIPVALFIIFRPVVEDRKVRNNVKNSDVFTQHYCFVLDCDEAMVIKKLSVCNIKDALKYTFDPEKLIIVFSHLNVSIEYWLYFYVVEDKTYLKVSREKFLHDRSNIPLMINRFFIEKIGAVPVDYNYFESITSIVPGCEISFEDITKLFLSDLEGRFCIEIEFLVIGYPKYRSCWMGKMPDKNNKGKELFWYGLVPDCSEAYDYDNFKDFSTAPVFNGKSLKELWPNIRVLSIDGTEPEERLKAYI